MLTPLARHFSLSSKQMYPVKPSVKPGLAQSVPDYYFDFHLTQNYCDAAPISYVKIHAINGVWPDRLFIDP